MSLFSKLSVVVIGRNEGQRLARCLDSVRAMKVDGWESEFIYVDSGSTDNSLQVAQERGFRTEKLVTDRPTAARGRNAGWRAASGDVVLFLDGDTIPHPDFVRLALPSLAMDGTAVVWGHRREIHPEDSIYNRVQDLDWVYAPGWTPFCGGDALFRRSVLEQMNGFDETLIAGEEPELCRRILGASWKILHVDLPMTGHDLAIHSFRSYWGRAERAGHAYAEVATRFAKTNQPFWQDEVSRNRKRALTFMLFPALLLLLAVALWSVWPLAFLVAAFATLFVRTAWKARWKSGSVMTLLLYGVHSHFQQIPIYFGQRRFQRNQRAGKKSQLLEYK